MLFQINYHCDALSFMVVLGLVLGQHLLSVDMRYKPHIGRAIQHAEELVVLVVVSVICECLCLSKLNTFEFTVFVVKFRINKLLL